MRRKGMTRFMLAFGLAISILVLAPSQALACSCKMADLAEQAGWADRVVTGTVRVKNEKSTTTDYEVSVDGTFKGGLVPTLAFSTANQGPACGVKLAGDERYLLFLQGTGDQLSTNSCSGTTQLTDAVRALAVAALGQPRVTTGTPAATPSADAPPATGMNDDGPGLKVAAVSGGFAIVAGAALLLYRRQRRPTS